VSEATVLDVIGADLGDEAAKRIIGHQSLSSHLRPPPPDNGYNSLKRAERPLGEDYRWIPAIGHAR
jgi:hypothetical protein